MNTRNDLQPGNTVRGAVRAALARARAPGPVALTLAASLTLGAVPAEAGPTGGVVVQGQGSISTPTAGTTVIDQSSQQLHLNWNSFDVGATETVQFNQPSSTAVALNRILDQNPSQIFGRLEANGKVVLVNPNGLLIGRTAQINVNSLVVSSLEAIDFDAASGRYRFATSRNNTGAVINEGSITADRGGSVTLLGGRVGNSGSIVADFGTVNLAAGRAATLDLAGDGLLRLEVDADLLANRDGAGSAVDNSGSIQAAGGRVLLTASAVQDVFANLVNNAGVVRANRIDNTGGVITLMGPSGTVLSSGTLDASAGDAVSTGGSVAVLGDHVGLVGNSRVDVSGATGGGTALIGGDYQGSNPNVLNATRTYVSSGTTLDADAGARGDGGRVIVWANDFTRYDGSLSARGGTLSGNGGFAEVSGKHSLAFTGTAALDAPHGAWGDLLLDPLDITIDSSGNVGPIAADDGTYTFAEDGGASVTIGSAKIESLLGSGDVTLQASNDITQLAGADIDVRFSAGAHGRSLSLQAGHDITLGGAIFLNDGAITLSGINSLVQQDGSRIDAGSGNISLSGGDIRLTDVATTSGSVTIFGNDISNDGNTATRIRANNLFLTSARAGAAGVGNALDTSITTLAFATANAGDMYIAEADGLSVVDAEANAPGSSLSIVSNTGNINVQTAQAFGNLSLKATAGSILDSGFPSTFALRSRTGTVSLDAAIGIGAITDFLSRAGSPVRIDSARAVNARVMNGAGNINLFLGGSAVDVAAGGIRLGTGFGASGSVILQRDNSLDVSLFDPGAIALGASNSARLALATDGTLILPSAIDITDQPAGTWLLHGADIIDTDGTPNTLALSANRLVFETTAPGAGKVLNTSVLQLDASLGGGRDLTVTDTDFLVLGSIKTAGNVTLKGAGLFDDGLPTVVAGNVVKFIGTTLGLFGNRLDTAARTLDLTVTNGGGVYVSEADDVTLSVSGTDIVDIATLDGSMNVTSASGHDVFLATGGTGVRSLTVSGQVNAGGGVVSLAAGGNGSPIFLDGNVNAGSGNVILTAGSPSNRGTIIQSPGNSISGNSIAMTGASVGSGGLRIQTAASTIDATSTNGGIYLTEADDLGSLSASATGGTVDVSTTDGSLVATTVAGEGVTLTAGGAAKTLTVDGSVDGGSLAVDLVASGADGAIAIDGAIATTDAVTMTAGTVGNRGALTAGAGNLVTASSVSATALSIGSSASRLNTSTDTLNATSQSGGIYVQEADALALTANATGGVVDVATIDGALDVTSVSGTGVTLTSGGAGQNINVNGIVDGGTGAVALIATGDGSAINLDALLTTTAGVTLTAGSLSSRGNIVAGAGEQIVAHDLTVTGALVGTSGARLATTVDELTASSTNGATFVTESDGLVATADAIAGVADIETTNGTLVANAVSGDGVRLVAGGAGKQLTVNGAVNGGNSDVSLDASGSMTLNDVVSTTADLVLSTGSGGSVALNSTLTGTRVGIAAGTGASGGAILAGNGNRVVADLFAVRAAQLGTDAAKVNTTVDALDVETTSGGIFINELDALTLTASAVGGELNVQTGNGALVVGSASGSSIVLAAGGAGNGITVRGPVNAGTGAVALTAGDVANRGAVVADTGNLVTGGTLTVSASSVGSGSSPLNTNIAALTANASTGGVYILEQNGLVLTDVRAGSDVNIATTLGDITVGTVQAAGKATLTADSGAIADDADDSTRVKAQDVILLARSIGAPSTLNGTALDSSQRLDIDATTLDATSTAGGIFIHELDGLDSVSVHASGGSTADLELLTETGDLKLLEVSAADTLLLAAGGNIFALPRLGTISARAAELRAGGADSSAGHIGTTAQPLSLQLSPGATLHMFVPVNVSATDANRAPATVTAAGVVSSLEFMSDPDTLSVQAGFGQFVASALPPEPPEPPPSTPEPPPSTPEPPPSTPEPPPSTPEPPPSTPEPPPSTPVPPPSTPEPPPSTPVPPATAPIQIQTVTLLQVPGLPGAEIEPNVSLYQTQEPAICMPENSLDGAKGKAGC
ncbi:MAG: filamentous hemagglutinin N-terminal domain-containing protein [Gammaproteobacteria bacterium]